MKAKKLTVITGKNLPGESHGSHGHDHSHDHGGSDSPLELLARIESLGKENEGLRADYERLLLQAGRALLKTLELRDPYTYGHSMRVMEYTMMIGRAASLSLRQLKTLELAAMFHDIGKVGTPDCVLLKPSRLTPEEQKIMAEHAAHSGEIIELIDEFKAAGEGVRHHHERFDGEGYPAGLSGKQIPLESRIILVGDTFDAMTSNRPYRKALPVETAYAELERFSGVQFDPEFVRIFMREHEKLVRSGAAPALEAEKAHRPARKKAA